jgi:hypothetical protein
MRGQDASQLRYGLGGVPQDPFKPRESYRNDRAAIAQWRVIRHKSLRRCLLRWHALADQHLRLQARAEWAGTLLTNCRVASALYWSFASVFQLWRRRSRLRAQFGIVIWRRAGKAAFDCWRRRASEVLVPARRMQGWQALVLAMRRWRLFSMWRTASSRLALSHWLRRELSRALLYFARRVADARSVTVAIAHDQQEAHRRGMAAMASSRTRALDDAALHWTACGVALSHAVTMWRTSYTAAMFASILLDDGALAIRRTRLRRGVMSWRGALRAWSSHEEVRAQTPESLLPTSLAVCRAQVEVVVRAFRSSRLLRALYWWRHRLPRCLRAPHVARHRTHHTSRATHPMTTLSLCADGLRWRHGSLLVSQRQRAAPSPL